jgi:hypothetical protein
MGKKSRADYIAELKSFGTKGSLSKMNLTKLKELHAKVLAENGQSTNEHSVPVAGTEKQNPTSVTAGQQQNMPAITTAGKKPLMIEPDSDDISEYLEGGSWWKSLAGDVSKAAKGVEKTASSVGKEVVKGAKEFQKSDIGKDIELGAVDVGEVGTIAAGDAALLASTVVDGPVGVTASAGLDVATSESANALREKIRDS